MYDRDRPYRDDGSNENINLVDLYDMDSTLRTDNSFAEWLTNGEWDEEKYTKYIFLKQLPVIGQYMQFLTDFYDDTSYMKNNQLTWDDLKRPWKLKSSNSGAAFIRSGLNFISDNVKRLYR